MLNIFYRLCEKEEGTHCEGRPEWFSKEKCLKSFLGAVENAKDNISNVVFVHDGPTGKLFDLIPDHYTIAKINEGNYLGSLIKTYEIANAIDDGDYYFVEDDYLHLPNSIININDAIQELEFLSPYDHLACTDTLKYIGQPPQVDDDRTVTINDQLWKINEFSCHTYVIRNDIFKKNKDIIMSDSCCRADLNFYRTMYSCGHPLWVPSPSLVTQVDTYMSPEVDWEEFNKTL